MSTDQPNASAADIFDRVRKSTDILTSAMERLEVWQSYRRAASILLEQLLKANAPDNMIEVLQNSYNLADERIEAMMSFICNHRAAHDKLMEVYNNRG